MHGKRAQKHFKAPEWSPTEDNIYHLLHGHTWDDAFHVNEVELTSHNMRVVIWEQQWNSGGYHKITKRIILEVSRVTTEP